MQTRTGTLISLCLLTLLHPAATVGADGQGLSTRRISVIPHPAKCEWLDGNLRVTAGTSITCEAPAGDVAHYLADTLAAHLGTAPKVEAQAQPRAGGIHLAVSGPLATLGDEGYVLTVKPDGLVLRANGPRGLFYGVQTLRQLAVPVAVASEQDQPSVEWPALHIEDVPRYRWRGMHLDVGRHFMPVEFVKQFIDLLAYHKFNTFHWHLTEDQGWRIQIERYPALTEVGAWREENGRRYGGFYTKSEVRAVVEHAAQRHVTIVPEIEMPGHSLAALAAYPKLSCTGGPFTITGKSGIYDDVYCAGNEATFTFLEGVLGEVCALFPGPYVHIGGDECPKKRWEACAKCQARMRAENLPDEHALQSYFIRRIEKFLNARDKRLVGWDEILEGGLAPNATVMSWRGTKGGIAAAQQGHDVIMCPTSHCYFDYRQADKEGEPGAPWAPVLDLATVYAFEPTPDELAGKQAAHVLGAQGNLWTERMLTPDDVEYMAFPRACALAEVAWSPASARDWEAFQERLATHLKRLDRFDVNYRKP
jgi:hexosaminidase